MIKYYYVRSGTALNGVTSNADQFDFVIAIDNGVASAPMIWTAQPRDKSLDAIDPLSLDGRSRDGQRYVVHSQGFAQTKLADISLVHLFYFHPALAVSCLMFLKSNMAIPVRNVYEASLMMSLSRQRLRSLMSVRLITVKDSDTLLFNHKVELALLPQLRFLNAGANKSADHRNSSRIAALIQESPLPIAPLVFLKGTSDNRSLLDDLLLACPFDGSIHKLLVMNYPDLSNQLVYNSGDWIDAISASDSITGYGHVYGSDAIDDEVLTILHKCKTAVPFDIFKNFTRHKFGESGGFGTTHEDSVESWTNKLDLRLAGLMSSSASERMLLDEREVIRAIADSMFKPVVTTVGKTLEVGPLLLSSGDRALIADTDAVSTDEYVSEFYRLDSELSKAFPAKLKWLDFDASSKRNSELEASLSFLYKLK